MTHAVAPASGPARDPAANPAFNNDILLHARDHERIGTLFPRLAPFLIHEELHALFAAHDKVANAAKRLGHRYGLSAVALGMFALVAAAAAPLLHKIVPGWISTTIASVAALAGIAGVVIGLYGGLHSRAKHIWLANRLMTERLRQFQFQTLAVNAPDLARAMGDDAAMAELRERRRRSFAAFRLRYENHLPAQLSAVIGDEMDANAWVVEPEKEAASMASLDAAQRANLGQIFEAYRLLRLEHQIGYANAKLDRGHGLSFGSPVRQGAILTFAAFACIGLTFVVHLAVAFHLTGSNEAVETVLHMLAIFFALTALGVRALEEGFRPKHEVERYLRYRAAMKKLLLAFTDTADPRLRIAAMHSAEEAAYVEMRDFLRTYEEALFVL